MQSYLKYKDYYDRKAKAAPLTEKDYRFVLQPKADSQASKIPFREYRWVGYSHSWRAGAREDTVREVCAGSHRIQFSAKRNRRRFHGTHRTHQPKDTVL